MRHLESITIHQFRGLRDVKLDNLGQVNLLVGINHSGKTSVLEALSIYCHPLDIRVWLSTARQREQENRIPRTSMLDSLRWLFTHHSITNQEQEQYIKETILISSQGEFPIQTMKASYQEMEEIWLSERNNKRNLAASQDEEIIDSDESMLEVDELPGIRKGIELNVEIELNTNQASLFPELDKMAETFQLWENDTRYKLHGKRNPSLLTAIVTPSSHRSDIGQFRLLSEARFDNFKSDVLELLQQIDQNISDIEILLPPGSKSAFNIYIIHEKLGLAPVSTFGDGIRRLLHIALKLASVKGGILLIDELESTIHTEALQSSFNWLVKWCKEMNVQLFATTHSLEAVDALLEVTESASDLVLYRLEPKETKTLVIRHDWNRLKRLREEQGQEVR
ncbi:AAA family ATPase [Planktothrix agardhii 1806]|jgi:predicted ATP-dependent endonuclease of OLD family|uniref:AAA+ ATPase domain-containing protein n=2 Tax=Planktothrix agardhii TaxID=1160 RepID=A0A073CDY6_PLAA1|nr:ATP-binding protein [Planktothrix agardhii]MCF3608198.1 AAA family ATPase [Planktothrix agardhii 1033]KEI65853.1 hypothetical protein A19Y_0682 [Planktothrix agardhii NIVA-CYA 126/8]MCB8752302.1 AAA family ATPase [Planktothrix agardhii 1810]MCF3569563.1 AAA family ATPase [Planktothrix agardhii 1805]MCF3583579.1 AAA family ATPase [Planktothrix agardhii 1803]